MNITQSYVGFYYAATLLFSEEMRYFGEFTLLKTTNPDKNTSRKKGAVCT